jgi:hypothetical protein
VRHAGPQIVTNKAFDWPFTFAAMAQPQVVDGYVKGVLLVTIACHAARGGRRRAAGE